MGHMSLRELKTVCRKGRWDPYWVLNILWRPFSIYVTWLLVRIGVPANAVTVVSLLLFLGSIVLLGFNESLFLILGAVLLQAYFLLDHVDGELARYEAKVLGRTPILLGKYLDAVTHRFSPALFFVVGWSASREIESGVWSTACMLLGFLAGFLMTGIASSPAAVVLVGAIRESPSMAQELRADLLIRPEATSYGKSNGLLSFLMKAKMLVGFPGWIFLITIGCLLDAFLEAPAVNGVRFPYRGLLLAFLTPIYALNLLAALMWHVRRFARIGNPKP